MVTHEQMTVATPDHDEVPLQSFARVYAQIRAGEGPWIALGNMMHQFFGVYKHRRAEFFADPLDVPEDASPELLRWAVFCAASVEYLSRIYELSCPAWALDARWSLDDPWFMGIGADLPRVQEKLRLTTPEEFTRRNIFCGERVYWNKYEYKGRRQIA
jgi:hypothetical protein